MVNGIAPHRFNNRYHANEQLYNNKLLLARNSNFPAAWYSLIAAYTDVGESLEECVIKEVKEEAGLDVWNIRY